MAIEGAVSLLVASLPVIGGRMIARWRHILTRHTVQHSLNLSRSVQSKHTKNSAHGKASVHSDHELDVINYGSSLFTGSQKTIETVVSAGDITIAESSKDDFVPVEEPVSLIQHMARIGRRGSCIQERRDCNSNQVTITKEVYIREEHKGQQDVERQ